MNPSKATQGSVSPTFSNSWCAFRTFVFYLSYERFKCVLSLLLFSCRRCRRPTGLCSGSLSCFLSLLQQSRANKATGGLTVPTLFQSLWIITITYLLRIFCFWCHFESKTVFTHLKCIHVLRDEWTQFAVLRLRLWFCFHKWIRVLDRTCHWWLLHELWDCALTSSCFLLSVFFLQSPSCDRTPADARPRPNHPESQETLLAVQRNWGSPHSTDPLCCFQPHKGLKSGSESRADPWWWKPPECPSQEPPERLSVPVKRRRLTMHRSKTWSWTYIKNLLYQLFE